MNRFDDKGLEDTNDTYLQNDMQAIRISVLAR